MLVVILFRIIGFNAGKHIILSYLIWITFAYVLSYWFYTRFELKVMNKRSNLLEKLKLKEEK